MNRVRIETFTILLWAVMALGRAPASAQEVLVPFYVYPAHFDAAHYLWDDLAQAAAIGPFTAVINPADGPEAGGPNADYQVGFAALRKAHVPWLGYVTTRLADVPLRPSADVRAEIDVWATRYASYGITGIFLDGTSSAEADVPYYEALYAYIRQKPGLRRVVLNPGTPPARAYYDRPTADTIVAFEGSQAAFSAHTPPSYMAAYPAARFGALIYGASTASALRSALALVRGRGYGAVYVTDDTLDNPWDSLPPYFAEELRDATSVPALSPSALIAAILGLCLTAAHRLGRRRGTLALAALLALAGCSTQDPLAPHIASAAPRWRVVTDPDTGEPVAHSPVAAPSAAATSTIAAPSAAAPTALPAAPPVELPSPGGGRMVRLEGAFHSHARAQHDAAGVVVACEAGAP